MTALQWIVKEAKKIKRKYPKRFTKWTDYVAQASAIYKSKHGTTPVGHAHKKLSGMAKRKRKKSSSRRRAAVRSARKHHAAEGRALRRISGIASTKRRLKDQTKEQMAFAFLARDQAKTKRAKKKIGKKISTYRRLLNHLSS